MLVTRRTLLAGSSTIALAGLAGCGSNVDPVVAWNTFIDSVTQLVAKGCSIEQGFVPTAATILAVVNVIFPGIGTLVTTVAGSVQKVADAICASLPPTPSASLLAAIAKATPTEPVHIGDVTLNGKTAAVYGYNARYGPQHVTAAMLQEHGFK